MIALVVRRAVAAAIFAFVVCTAIYALQPEHPGPHLPPASYHTQTPVLEVGP